MRINKSTRTQRRFDRNKRMEQWHRWFAWRPVRVDGLTLVWMEYVMRRESDVSFAKFYKTIDTAIVDRLTE